MPKLFFFKKKKERIKGRKTVQLNSKKVKQCKISLIISKFGLNYIRNRKVYMINRLSENDSNIAKIKETKQSPVTYV